MPKDELFGGRFMPRVQTGEPITLVDQALVLPRTGKGGFAVVDGNGAPVVDAVSFRKDGLEFSDFIDRSTPRKVRHHAGRYLYAGDYWSHFGHFIFESLARLWALDFMQDQLDGIVFLVPRRGEVDAGLRTDSMQARFLAMLGIDLPVLLISEPTSFDQLYVPRQGCGMGGMAAGTPSHRRFLQNRLRKVEPKPGMERVYLTRSGYGLRRGGIFGEGFLEQNLIAQGYVIYSPEQAPIEDQIATYLGARQIVAPDSSALHLFGFVARPEQDLAIVLRRKTGAKDLLPQIIGFSGRKPLVLDCITRTLSRDNARMASWGQFADLDFGALGGGLAAAGFIDPALWHGLSDWRRDRLQRNYEARLDCKLQVLDATAEFADDSPARGPDAPM